MLIGTLAFAYSLWAVAGSGQDNGVLRLLLLMAGIPFYVWSVYKKSTASSSH